MVQRSEDMSGDRNANLGESLELVYAAIDEINATSASGNKIEKAEDTNLLGEGSQIDSLDFVNLMVAIEDQIRARLHKPIVLVNEDTLTGDEHPFRTVGTLSAYVARLLDS